MFKFLSALLFRRREKLDIKPIKMADTKEKKWSRENSNDQNAKGPNKPND